MLRSKNDRLWYVWMTEATSSAAMAAAAVIVRWVWCGGDGARWSLEQINT